MPYKDAGIIYTDSRFKPVGFTANFPFFAAQSGT